MSHRQILFLIRNSAFYFLQLKDLNELNNILLFHLRKSSYIFLKNYALLKIYNLVLIENSFELTFISYVALKLQLRYLL